MVTGAGSGIGRALSERLARAGCIVVAADIDAERVARVVDPLCDEGCRAHAVELDVVDAEAVKRVIDEVAEGHGGIDYLFNNAGIAQAARTEQITVDDWNRVLDVNLRGVVHGVAAAYPHMVRRGRGHIVNTASVAGLLPLPNCVAYATSKHAVVGLSVSLAAEAALSGVHVSVVCPGYIRTNIYDAAEYAGIDRERALATLPGKGMAAEAAAGTILRGVGRKQVIIPVTAFAWFGWFAFRLWPGLVIWFAARMSRRAISDGAPSDPEHR